MILQWVKLKASHSFNTYTITFTNTAPFLNSNELKKYIRTLPVTFTQRRKRKGKSEQINNEEMRTGIHRWGRLYFSKGTSEKFLPFLCNAIGAVEKRSIRQLQDASGKTGISRYPLLLPLPPPLSSSRVWVVQRSLTPPPSPPRPATPSRAKLITRTLAASQPPIKTDVTLCYEILLRVFQGLLFIFHLLFLLLLFSLLLLLLVLYLLILILSFFFVCLPVSPISSTSSSSFSSSPPLACNGDETTLCVIYFFFLSETEIRKMRRVCMQMMYDVKTFSFPLVVFT